MKRIFITGASGCIGHFIVQALLEEESEAELFLLVRDPDKLKFDPKTLPHVHILQGDLREIEQFADLLETINVAILAATSWGGAAEAVETNVVKTLALLELLDPQSCQQVIYFSTASILGRDNQLLEEAGKIGTDYIRTKYACYSQLSQLPIADRITTLFPTLVVGGGPNMPHSHLSSGLPDVIQWMDLIRWFKADGGFHFVHARDIAQVVRYLAGRPPHPASPQQLVLGNPAITVDEAVQAICTYLRKRIYFRIPLSVKLADVFIAAFRLKMAAWDRFCLNYRHFTYSNPVTPASFGLTNYCSTVADVLRLSGIPPG